MRNITVAVDDDVYRRARMAAAAMDTSVSALVSRYLRQLAGETETERLKRQERDVRSRITEFTASVRIPARMRTIGCCDAPVSRHEYSPVFAQPESC